MKKAVFPGSFDPITLGHVDIIKRGLPLFDEIVIGIGINAKKNYMFSVEERMKFIGNTFFAEEKISVETYKGLTVNYCKEINANFILRGLRNPADFEFEKTENNTFKVTLPKTNLVVELRLLTGKDEKWLTKAMEQKRKNKLAETILTDQIRLFTVSVNGISDKLTLNQFINTLPASDSRFLRNAYKALTPNLDLKQEFCCPECGSDTTMEVPFTADFFWPKS